jgi:FkbM family methyltransferase
MITARRINKFLQKPPREMWTTTRFLTTMWLSKLSYAPHRTRLRLDSAHALTFWWSYFPASFSPDKGLFEYWGDDIGDLRFLWKYLKPGMTFFDIGAFHGIYSMIAAKKLGSTGRVVAFEPSQRERNRMNLHLRYNKINSVTLEPYALATEEGKAQLNIVVEGYTTMNSLRPPATDHPVNQTTVETISLDAYLNRKRTASVDLLKIDVEGGEVAAFRGADHLLSHVRPLIICEVLDRVTQPWGYPASDIMNMLRAYGYEWSDILSDGSLLPHRPKGEYMDARNYLAVPQEKQALL